METAGASRVVAAHYLRSVMDTRPPTSLLSWLDEAINDADLALRDEQVGLQLLTRHLDPGSAVLMPPAAPLDDSHLV
jgi:hypothetical protein